MRGKECYDHLGNKYNSITAMCDHYGISVSAYIHRISKGKTIKEALTTPTGYSIGGSIKCTDHLNNEYPSYSAMCKAYHITTSTFWNRVSKFHMSIEDALTMPTNTQDTVGKTCTDHLGNTYNSVMEMLQLYGIPRNIYYNRMKKGWSQKDALTLKPTNKNGCQSHVYDHLGHDYGNIMLMCKAYGISVAEYGSRIRQGWTKRKALTTPHTVTMIGKKECVDHLGNHYRSQAEMARKYGVTKDQLRSRIELGWTLEEILTTPKPIEHTHKIKDHTGKEWNSKKEMFAHYGTSPQIVKRRMEKLGLSYEEALTVENLHTIQCTDHLGNKYRTLQDMQCYYNIGSCYHHRYKVKKWSLKKTLTTISSISKPQKFSEHLSKIKALGSDYYEVVYYDIRYVWHINTLLDIYHKEKCVISTTETGLITCQPIDKVTQSCE